MIGDSSLSTRTEKIVGREGEIKRLHDLLIKRGERHYIFYHAIGGLGKTRLLQAVNTLVEEANKKEPGYHTTGIIDLYHTDTHSTSDVERAIIDGLDPEQKYFLLYRSERKKFEEWRERGIDPEMLERHRRGLGQLFVEEWGKLALDARKLVICFDTVELLQYESSIVEEKAGLDTADTRLKPWLLDKLSQLKNVLVVFAGRPKLSNQPEDGDPHLRLVEDFRTAFGNDFTSIQLDPLTLNETDLMLKSLSRGQELIPPEYLPIVHRLTQGRPIFIHLIVDYLGVLAPGTRDYFEKLDRYKELAEVPDEDPRLQAARKEIEKDILYSVFNRGGDLGEYLGHIAVMPKGVDADILHSTLGISEADAQQLLQRLSDLSFIKRYTAPRGAPRLHGERTFLHDELYRLLTEHQVIRAYALNVKRTAFGLIENYYKPRIADLEQKLKGLSAVERVEVRDRLHKLQVECLYYMLANDPDKGYAEYKRLTDQANRSRSVGFSMRLLDEFLRFYNDKLAAKQAGNQEQSPMMPGITYEQVIRESTQSWVERFYWWGQRERAGRFSQYVLDHPDEFFIDPHKDLAVLANICARWMSSQAVLLGHQVEAIERACEYIEKLPALEACDETQALALARLHNAVGYQYRLGGMISKATEHYGRSKVAYEYLQGLETAPKYPDEYALLLNNLAYAYAIQGRMSLARPLAHESLNIPGKSEYTHGLTLSTLAAIARMRGNYSQAQKYGERAYHIFDEIDDPHGKALARLSIAFAQRRMSKHDAEKNWELGDAFKSLQEALHGLEAALAEAEMAGLEADVRQLQAEQGRIYRELGNIAKGMGDEEQSREFYGKGRSILEKTLESEKWPQIERADTLQDLAEIAFISGDKIAAQSYIDKLTSIIAESQQITALESAASGISYNEMYAPLGKSEMLRGQIAFSEKRPLDGLKHFIRASVYFSLFSTEATEIDTMIEYLYNHLRPLHQPEKKLLIGEIVKWIEDENLGKHTAVFMESLRDLLGV